MLLRAVPTELPDAGEFVTVINVRDALDASRPTYTRDMLHFLKDAVIDTFCFMS
jgi:hypothetical protein